MTIYTKTNQELKTNVIHKPRKGQTKKRSHSCIKNKTNQRPKTDGAQKQKMAKLK